MSPSSRARAASPRARVFKVLKWGGGVVLALVLLPYVITPLYLFARPVSTIMVWRWGSGQRVERIYAPLSEVAPVAARSVIVAEDGRFCFHWGVDLAELRDALTSADDFDDMRGGSTITQQVAKNLFLWPGRSYVRKALELPLAIWIDLVLSKRRIMEIYLNIAEWGPNGEFGIEAGARRAFNQPASRLTPQQAALMAAILPNPIVRDARRPGPGLRRLAGIYVRRALVAREADKCLRGKGR